LVTCTRSLSYWFSYQLTWKKRTAGEDTPEGPVRKGCNDGYTSDSTSLWAKHFTRGGAAYQINTTGVSFLWFLEFQRSTKRASEKGGRLSSNRVAKKEYLGYSQMCQCGVRSGGIRRVIQANLIRDTCWTCQKDN